MGTILEEAGANQWHVWAIASGFRSWSEWTALLASVVTDANLNGAGVGYSEFPSPAALLTPRSLGLRAPGAWNPVEERLATIHCHNLHRFLPLIIRRYEGAIAKSARI